MSILNITGLYHKYDDKVLFDNVDLSVNNYEHIGIVGLNGAGKSTFMNILTGEVLHDGGEVKWLKGLQYSYLDQHADIDKTLTVIEYLRLSFRDLFAENERLERMYEQIALMTDPVLMDVEISRASVILDRLTRDNFFEIDADIKRVANGLGINAFGYNTIVGILSGGQRAKLMLAKMILENPDVLLLDEPTNFLDTMHITWLAEYLRNYKGTFLLISHDTQFLDLVCNFIVSLSNKSIKKFSGNYTQFLAQYEMAERQYSDEYERQKKDIKKLEEYIAKNKARAATAGMANSRQKQLDKIVELDKPVTMSKPTFEFPYIYISCKEILVVKNLEIGYTHPLLRPISFAVTPDTKLWIRGANGIGKSTLIKTITGRIKKLGGFFEYNINAKNAYIEQELEFTDRGESALGYLSSSLPKMSQKSLRQSLAATGMKQELATRAIENLSGGEQMRIKLCLLSNRPSNILLLDEPTNHLDKNAKAALVEAVTKYEGAVILVTHEPAFADEVCNDILTLEL